LKSIVLAEKPSVGRELARVLGCNQKKQGYLEGKDYIVTWAMGHLVELADPGVYDERYKTWSLDYLPMLPDSMRHKVIKKSSGQFRTIKGILSRKDTNLLVVATDAGREGELVARWIMRLGGWKGRFKRLWISSQTDTAIRQGFQNLKDGREFDNLFRAAETRAEADWIIGLNVTRALSCRYDARLSAGRVQTPTLALIIRREREIQNFRPEAFWTIHADFGVFSGTWQGTKGATRLKDQARAMEIRDKVETAVRESSTGAKPAVISDVQSKEKQEQPPLAYDLTALQRDANAQFNFSAKKTLQVLQGLYERHKIVTYPRTDSRYITRDIVPTLKDRLIAVENTQFAPHIKNLLKGGIEPGKRFVNDGKVSDHHALIPTELKVNLDRLEADERAVWGMVVRRFLEVLMPPHLYKSLTITTEAAGEKFISRGRTVVDPGWKKIGGSAAGPSEDEENEVDIGEQRLSVHKKGEKLTVKSVDMKQGFTKPPPRYTEGTLLGAMENPAKFITDETLKKSISGGGLGTPATRAEIIEKIINKYYIERKGMQLVPTSKGFELLDVVPDELKSPELTARWELRLQSISEGREDGRQFRHDIRENASALVHQIKGSTQKYSPRDLSDSKCPLCGRNMLSVHGKYGKKKLVCQALSCGYEEGERGKDGSRGKPSRKEQAMSRKLIDQYSDKAKDTATFADLIKASMEKKQQR
jgi:DNA topoisomerase III